MNAITSLTGRLESKAYAKGDNEMVLKFLRKAQTQEQGPQAVQFIESSAQAIAKINLAGGYSLTILALGGAVIIVALILWRFVDAVADALPYLVALTAFMSVLGVIMYFIDSTRKQKLIEQSFTQYHELAKIAFDKYLQSQETLGDFQWKGVMESLDRIYGDRKVGLPVASTKQADD